MKKLAQGAIGTGAGTLLYTVPTGIRTEVYDVLIANTTSGSLNCSIHLVPTGVAVGTSNAMFSSVPIPGNTTIHWSGIQVLNAGDFIQGISSASGLTVNITGDEGRAGT